MVSGGSSENLTVYKKIEDIGKQLKDIINVIDILVPKFSDQKDYEYGEICRYQNDDTYKMYQFIYDKSAGAWEPSVVQETTLQKVIKEFVDALEKAEHDIFYAVHYQVMDLDNPPESILLRTSVGCKGLPTQLGGNNCVVLQFPGGKYSGQLALSFASYQLALRYRFGTTQWTSWKFLTAV